MTAEPLTITEAAPLVRRGELTPSELLEQCLARIDVYEPAVRAWAYLDRERARRDADRLTDELKRGQHRGPLHGIPVGVKDIIDVFDMPTGCGSKLWANSYARRDATVVERLRQAGAVIVGKTVTTPYAYLDPPPTRNPWNLERTPGGSSSGSAAAVACGMCLAALGTQTGGSVVRPASFCGIYSLKLTRNSHLLEGALPLAPSLDHLGVMANSVRDLAVLMRVVSGHWDYATYGGTDVREPLPYDDPLPGSVSWGVTGFGMKRVKRRPVRGLHLDSTVDFFPDRATPEMRERFAVLLARLHADSEPSEPTQPIVLPSLFGSILADHKTVMASEAAVYHKDRYERHYDDYPPRIAELIEDGLRVSGAALTAALDRQAKLRFELNQRDLPRALILPAAPGPAPGPETTGDATFNSPWSFIGASVVSLPFAWSGDGLPLGLQIVGERFTEDALIGTAEQLEEVVGWNRRLPPVP